MNETENSLKRVEHLESMFVNWRLYHQDVASWCLPRKAWQTTIKNIGDRLKLGSLYDSTAILSLRIMSAGFHSNLTNPSSKWFALKTRDNSFMDSHVVKLWFREVEDIIFSVLNASNFDTTMQEFYIDAGSLGTGVVMTLEDSVDKVRFSIIPLEQVCMEEDAQGRVNRLYRTYPMTVQQAYDLWGEAAGPSVVEKVKDKPYEMVTIVHCVGPRDKRDAGKEDNVNMPYYSQWINKKDKHVIRESGFVEFPFAVGRFYKSASDVFGFSPAMDAMATIKLINAQHRTLLRANMKAADPALSVPRKGFVAPLNANPSALNYRDANVEKDAIQAFPTSPGLSITKDILMMEQESVRDAFFVPLFRALSEITKQMTIPEVQRRIAENMVLLGPVVGRFTDEVLDPIINRVFGILYRNMELPPVPEELQGQEMDIVYISPLAKAQRESEIFSIESFLNDVGAISALKPMALDMVDEDAAVNIIAEVKGINPKLLKDKSAVDAVREQRAKQEAMAAQISMVGAGAQAAKTGAEIDALTKQAAEGKK